MHDISSADCHGKQTVANHRDAAGCDPRRLRGCGCRAAHTRGKTARARAAPGADPCAKRRADTMRAMLLHRRFGGTCRWAYAFCSKPPASARCIRREHTDGADVRPRAITSGYYKTPAPRGITWMRNRHRRYRHRLLGSISIRLLCLHFLQYSGKLFAVVSGRTFWSVRRPQFGQSKNPCRAISLPHFVCFCNTFSSNFLGLTIKYTLPQAR